MAQSLTRTRKAAQSAPANRSWGTKLDCPWVLSLALAAVTLAVYLPAAHNDFVNYDDSDYVTANQHVQEGLSWKSVVWAFTTGHASNWHPLTWVAHMLDCQLFGQNAGAHHLVSLGFHMLNSVLLLFLLRRLTGEHWKSALVAGLFALHPLHVESVAWVSERKDVLSALFFMLTLLAWTNWVKSEVPRPKSETSPKPQAPSPQPGSRLPRLDTRQNWAWYLGALMLFACGLMSKPMLVSLPFVLLLLDVWPFERVWPRSMENSGIRRRDSNFVSLVVEKLPFFALAASSSVITYAVQQMGGAVSTSISLSARLANALVSYARYLGKTFWPYDLSVLYPHPGHWPLWAVIGAAVLLLLITGLAIKTARTSPFCIVGWLWFLGCLVPVIGLVQVGVQSMADRYMYIPSIGLFVAVVWGLAEMGPRLPFPREAWPGLAVVVLCFCAGLSWKQVHYWHNSGTLFRRAIQVTPNNYLAYNNLGFYLSNCGKIDEAMENYEQSLKINPLYEDALNNLGYAWAGKKDFARAVGYYEAALRIKPDHVEVHNNLGNALSELGRIDEAIEHYRFVLARKPDHADAHNNLGIALAMKGKLDEAVPHFEAAIRYKRNYASAHSNLGNAYAVQHRLEEATREYEISLRLNPKDAQAHNNLGNVLAEQGKLQLAIDNYKEALRLNADNPEAQCNLGFALARLGQREEAIAHFREALRLKPGYGEAKRQLEALSQTATSTR